MGISGARVTILILVGLVSISIISIPGVTGQGSFSVTFHTYNDGVAQPEGITVNGTVDDSDSVVLVFVSQQGEVQAEEAPITNGQFEADVSFGFARGQITGIAIASGSDGRFGDGSANDRSTRTADEFVSYVETFNERSLTKTQALTLIREESVEDTASDDYFRSTSFELEEPRTSVEALRADSLGDRDGVPAGGTIFLQGTTNLSPMENRITVSLLDTNTDLVTIEEWNSTGTWVARIPVPKSVSTGTYTLEIATNWKTRTTTINVTRPETPTPTATPSPTPTASPTSLPMDGNTTTATTSSPPTPPQTTTSSQKSTPTRTGPTTVSRSNTPNQLTTGSGPGFGPVLALVSVVTTMVLIGRLRSE